MTLCEALNKIEEYSEQGERTDICVRRYGRLLIDRGGIQRGVEGCAICGHFHGMGCIVVQHNDGRRVVVDLRLYHYAKAGHPISDEEIDEGLLLSIIADA